METEIETERRNRIRVSLWAYAYELGAVELATDNQFDELCKRIRPEIKTGRLDDFFATEFHPDTGQWIHNHPELDGIKRIYELLTKETRMTTEQTVPLTDVLALMHKTGEIFQEFARVVSVAAPGVATMSLESAVAGGVPTAPGGVPVPPGVPAAPVEEKKKTRTRKAKKTEGGITEEHEVAAVYNAVKAPAAPAAPAAPTPATDVIPSFMNAAKVPPVPVAPPAPPAAFPPEGWQLHPSNPQYYHNGVEVITEEQLRARMTLPATRTGNSPYVFERDASLEDFAKTVRQMCEDATKKDAAFSATKLQTFMTNFNGTGVTTLQEVWADGGAYQFLSELEALVLAA